MDGISKEVEIRLVNQMHSIIFCIPARHETRFGFEFSHIKREMEPIA